MGFYICLKLCNHQEVDIKYPHFLEKSETREDLDYFFKILSMRECERDIESLFHLFMHALVIRWLIPVYALTKDPTHNFGISGQGSTQLSYPARALRFGFMKSQSDSRVSESSPGSLDGRKLHPGILLSQGMAQRFTYSAKSASAWALQQTLVFTHTHIYSTFMEFSGTDLVECPKIKQPQSLPCWEAASATAAQSRPAHPRTAGDGIGGSCLTPLRPPFLLRRS